MGKALKNRRCFSQEWLAQANETIDAALADPKGYNEFNSGGIGVDYKLGADDIAEQVRKDAFLGRFFAPFDTENDQFA